MNKSTNSERDGLAERIAAKSAEIAATGLCVWEYKTPGRMSRKTKELAARIMDAFAPSRVNRACAEADELNRRYGCG